MNKHIKNLRKCLISGDFKHALTFYIWEIYSALNKTTQISTKNLSIFSTENTEKTEEQQSDQKNSSFHN